MARLLDEIRPERWTGEMTVELLEFLWVLEATVEEEPELAAFLEEVTAGPVLEAEGLSQPTGEQRGPPAKPTELVQDELGLS